jgi:hypothetical protein
MCSPNLDMVVIPEQERLRKIHSLRGSLSKHQEKKKNTNKTPSYKTTSSSLD